MIEFENNKVKDEDLEEEKIIKNARRVISNHENQMRDARSVSRNEFTKVKLVNQRIAMNEIPQMQEKERRQKIIQDNRGEEKSKKEVGITYTKDPNKISKMIKDLSQVLNNYISITIKEIDNIKRFAKLNHSAVIEGNMKL